MNKMMIQETKNGRCPLCGHVEKRSNEQNKRYWACLNEISEQLKTADGLYSSETWHCYFRQRFLGCEDVKLPNRNHMIIPRSTTELDVKEFVEYMERVEHFAHEHGVIFNYDEVY